MLGDPTQTAGSNARLLLGCAVLLEGGFVALCALGDLGRQVPRFLLVYLLACAVYMTAVWAVARRPSRAPWPERRTVWLIWTAAIVFRLTLLPLTPGLSDDLARYRWQGQVQAAGGNPYLAVPADPQWSGLRDAAWPQVTRKDLASSYGPLLELSYRWTFRLADAVTDAPQRQVWLFKLPFALAELGVGGAVWLLLGLCGLPRERALIYLWSPLIVVEFWAQGHNDSLAMLGVVLALAAARAGRGAFAWAALTAATLAKLWPALLAPLFLFRKQEGRWRLDWKPLWVVVPLTAAAVWPYSSAVLEAGKVLGGFAGGWRNNDSLYGWILAWTGGDADAAVRWAALALAAVLAWVWATQRPRERAALWSIAALLLLSANCFPWYLSWLVPLLALYPNPALLLWTALVGLAYHVVTGYAILGVWEEAAFYRRLEYGPVLALLLGGWAARQLRERVLTPAGAEPPRKS